MRFKPEDRLPEWRNLEIREYIDAFKASSDRARYVIYVNAVVSLLILVCTWNTTALSWSRQGVDRAEGTYMQQTVNPVQRDRARLYRDTALPRIWFVPVPGLGVNIHVNDLGILGGVMLLILSALLCLSMVRQHENLYLALFKVRRLCEYERGKCHDGESMSNFLYHSLAMGQVLNYPPTLARWTHGYRNRLAGGVRWIVLCLPLLVHGTVVGYNFATYHIARQAWGPVAKVRMSAQVVLFALIATACLLAGIYSRACNYRWRAAFNLINPGLKQVEPRPWLDWVRLRQSRDIKPPYLLAELTYTLQPELVMPAQAEVTASGVVEKIAKKNKEPYITQKNLAAMSKKLEDDAKEQIAAKGGGTIENWEVIASAVGADDVWRVRAICRYRPETPPAPRAT